MSDGYRTQVGDVLTDPRRGTREVLAIWRAEDIDRFVDARCYLRRLEERCALHGGGRRTTAKAGRS